MTFKIYFNLQHYSSKVPIKYIRWFTKHAYLHFSYKFNKFIQILILELFCTTWLNLSAAIKISIFKIRTHFFTVNYLSVDIFLLKMLIYLIHFKIIYFCQDFKFNSETWSVHSLDLYGDDLFRVLEHFTLFFYTKSMRFNKLYVYIV